jgi:hypothetical protein
MRAPRPPIGSEFLVKVCLEALDWRGAVREHIEELFMDAMTDVFVLERINLLDPDADKPVLRGMFVQAIFSTLSRGMDILFVHADPDELPFWRDTIGARQVGDFIAASGARCLPVYPKPPRPLATRVEPSDIAAPPRRRQAMTVQLNHEGRPAIDAALALLDASHMPKTTADPPRTHPRADAAERSAVVGGRVDGGNARGLPACGDSR